MSLFLIGDILGRVDEHLKALASMPPGSTSIALGGLFMADQKSFRNCGPKQILRLFVEHSKVFPQAMTALF